MDWLRQKVEVFLSDVALNSVMALLLGVSCLATWAGLSDFAVTKADVSLVGGLSVRAFIAILVVILTLAMYVALRELLKPKHWLNWLPALLLYAVLAVWSVGFGYGFWWSLLAGNSATDASFSKAISAVEQQAISIESDIAAITSQMDNAVRLSQAKAEQEAERGGTCGVASRGGAGKFLRARQETQTELATLSETIKAEWLLPLESQIQTLSNGLPISFDPAATELERQEAFSRRYGELQRTAASISSSARARGIVFSQQLRNKAKRLRAAPEIGRDPYCYDPDLASSLVIAAEQLERAFAVNVPEFEFSDGSDGVALAVERLWLRIWTATIAPSTDESAELIAASGSGASSTGDTTPIVSGGRGIAALVAAVAIDLAIFVFAVFQSRRPTLPRTRRKEPIFIDPDHIPEALVVDSDPEVRPFSEPVMVPVDAQRLLTGPVIDVEEPADDAQQAPLFHDSSGSFMLTLDTEREIRDRIAKYDNAVAALEAAEDDRQRDEAIADIDKREKELAFRDVHPFGEVGDIFDSEYEVVGERIVDGEAGEILEVRRKGFRHQHAGLIRKARVVIIKRD